MTTAADCERPRVLYVMGAGRSGSTTLGITLGNCENVLYAGELDNWLPRSGVPQVPDPDRLRFWSRVRDELEDPGGAENLFGTGAQHAIERSLSLFRIGRWRERHRLRRPYRAVAGDLYRALTRAGGVTHIADSSHYPLRAREMQRVEGIDLYLLFLARDPQGVVASFNRQDVAEYTKSTLHANVYLWVTHLLSLLVFLRHPRERRLYVSYEEFLADPGTVVGQILELSGLPAGELPDFQKLRVGFPLQGNRVTRSQTMSLKPRTDAVPSRSLLTALLQAPLVTVLKRLAPSAGSEGKERRAR